MKKPANWNTLIDSFGDCNCPYAYIVGYYLSRFDKDAYQKLELGNNKGETHQKIGSILEISSNTLKNFRDAFDPYHENSRKGWWQRDLWRVEKEIYNGFKAYSENELYELVCKILSNPKQDFKDFFDSDQLTTEIDNITLFPDEVNDTQILTEGSVRQVTVNAYERNNQGRKLCIEYYGTNCYVCGVNFEKIYGEIGQEFIHVHHLIPLFEINQEYEIDPIQDLRPVCPNCHAMIHRKNPPYTIEEIKNMLQ
ncbi:HNH endonuclease [Dolichospermum sp. ST_con]|nr:HNH endonuclease [Dolichospermum sp. ST_con]MDD1420195.1 HNH endonuclease [Dolichospermum sp. ST_sed1]MDD1425977.1 HNH endonuclease [Dolichospermum sp. ST_sed9]MDD1432445.1 HNH endonuclease [Dolichospermum sp. ST_sed6]MDD1436067.1 HNH endonuclease [Dolichospermum sp. ST_sed10]MDD1441823.1 HNH endonuclease [Dolichospermum sp. ST_sed3]MDD1445351.1 HNH endonuclease [Dolichospermum sp. ST_sed8]MDD1454563.1 HNH endonuclease [Dolichospermum sp. ST_sed7]MDD1461696.1 HNH endonuclease [Dolichospe